ncbi:O-antigen ligase family protein [Geodermatophilus sabuli]|uniref:O-antigen ligase n=1 Tax=Geodermatophilus sabuli TaxID=1564158 RepID=A0A285EF26_9ACTN|nr:O-antigen ligase family protein [Geodermatophilus sabuli]MBB3083603.1 O-antigen ligase [Geodermatophilus sabuli]SNX96676.1 O-antigen ligase [Geodermatophilus sabuli]
MTQLVDQPVAATATDQPAPSRLGGPVTAVAVAIGCAVLGVAVLAVTVTLGLPLLAPVVAALVLAVPLLLVRPVLFVVLVGVVEAGNLSGVGAVNGLPGGESALLALAVVAAVLAWLRGHIRPAWSPFLSVAVLYVVVQTIAVLTAQDVDTAFVAVAVTAKAMVWPVVLVVLLLAPGRGPQALARAFALTLAALAALTVVQEFVVGNDTTFAGLSTVPLAADLGGATARHAGPQDDANFWGRVLVLGFPFALSLAQMATSRWRRTLWLCAALAIFGGVVLTGSRGGLLALFVVLCFWALLAGGAALKALVLAPLGIGLALMLPGVGSRLLTLNTLGVGGLEVTDPSLEGRIAAQTSAFQMVVDHPVLGVGPGNFLLTTPDYLRRLGLDSLPLAPHNLYLEAAAEGGLLGLLAWLLLVGAAALVALRARHFARAGGSAMGQAAPLPLANAVLAALLGWSVASIFLHMATLRSFLLVAALGAALDIRARRRAAELRRERGIATDAVALDLVRPRSRPGRALRWAAAGLATLLLVLAATLWTAGGRPGTVQTVTTDMQLVVKFESDSESPSYDLDTLSRTGLVRTLAGIATSDRFEEEGLRRATELGVFVDSVTIESSASVDSGLITVTASGPDAGAATVVAFEVRAAAVEFVNTLSPLYGALPVAGEPLVKPAPEPAFDRRIALVPLALGGLLVLGLAVDLAQDGLRRRRVARGRAR